MYILIYEINSLAQVVLSVLLVYLWDIFCIMCWFTKLGQGETLNTVD